MPGGTEVVPDPRGQAMPSVSSLIGVSVSRRHGGMVGHRALPRPYPWITRPWDYQPLPGRMCLVLGRSARCSTSACPRVPTAGTDSHFLAATPTGWERGRVRPGAGSGASGRRRGSSATGAIRESPASRRSPPRGRRPRRVGVSSGPPLVPRSGFARSASPTGWDYQPLLGRSCSLLGQAAGHAGPAWPFVLWPGTDGQILAVTPTPWDKRGGDER